MLALKSEEKPLKIVSLCCKITGEVVAKTFFGTEMSPISFGKNSMENVVVEIMKLMMKR